MEGMIFLPVLGAVDDIPVYLRLKDLYSWLLWWRGLHSCLSRGERIIFS
jgi:hypothetical protein